MTHHLDDHCELAVVPRAGRGCGGDDGERGRVVPVQRYEYRVVQLRESMIGGKLSPDKLERVLNDEAEAGRQLKAITATDVKGRVGPGAVEGLLITFERPTGWGACPRAVAAAARVATAASPVGSRGEDERQEEPGCGGERVQRASVLERLRHQGVGQGRQHRARRKRQR